MHIRRFVSIPALLVALLGGLSALPAQAEGAVGGNTISTDGGGEVAVPADGAKVRLGVQAQGDTAAAASATAARRLASLVAALEPLGDAIAPPVSSGYSVSPEWKWDEDGDQRVLLGYTASSALRVEVRDLDRLGDVIDAALAGDADDVGSPTFTSSREREARDRALAIAYRQAARDAEVLAEAAGGSLGELLELTTNPSSFRGGRAFEEIVVTGQAAGVRIENPEVVVRVTVAGRWRVTSTD